jgi:hypothetical protein
MFWFSAQILSETFLPLSRIKRDIVNVLRSLCKLPVILCKILIKLKISRQIFEKYTNIKFYENPSSGNCVIPCGRTERDRTKLIVAVRNFTKAPKINMFLTTVKFDFCLKSIMTFFNNNLRSLDYGRFEG